MKKKLTLTLFFIVLFTTNILSQGWQWIDTGFPVIIFDMSFPPGQSSTGFAVGSSLTSGGDGIILKTTDGGSSWTKISTDTIPGLRAVCFTSLDVGYAAGYQNFFMKTTDGGTTWALIIVDSKLWYFNNIEFWDANIGVVVSYPSLVYRTTDAGNTWTPTFGLKHSVEDICYADSTTLFLVGGDERIYKSTNSGFFWTEVDTGEALHTYLGVDFYSSNYGIVTGENGKILVTANGGNDWNVENTGGSGWMAGVRINDELNAYVVGSSEQVFKTTDCGITWFSDFNDGTSIDFYKIIFTENNTRLICGSGGKFLINTDNVIPVELINFTAHATENSVQLNWSTGTELNNSGFEILRSIDNGDWMMIGFVPGSGTSTEVRNYSFSDEQIESGSYSYRLKQIDFDGNFEYSHIVNVIVSIPAEYNLEQNYPNPFNPSTTIKFSLPQATEVSLIIYNLLGEKITELADGNLEVGSYSYQWEATDIPNGIYIYELRTDNFISIKKMILLK